MIIAFSGRAKSGKTLLADTLVPLGFKKISFADKLRSLICELFDWNIKDLTDVTKKEKKFDVPIVWNEKLSSKLAKLIKANKQLISEEITLNSMRDVMQFVGTEVLRKYDPEFHIKETIKTINNQNITIDDCRFKDELDALKKMGAISVFISRPYFNLYYNHKSEVNLNRNNFEYTLINDGSKSKIIKKFKKFYENLGKYDYKRQEIVDVLDATKYHLPTAAKILKCNAEDIKELMKVFLIHKPDIEYNGLFIKQDNISKYWFDEVVSKAKIITNGRKYLSVDNSKNFREAIGYKKKCVNDKLIIKSPLLMEDLKLWDFF